MSKDGKIVTAYFEVLDAGGVCELRNACYHLRYQVYCVERGFLSETDYPDEKESDLFDAASSHFLARHRDSQVAAGTARLVKYSDQGLPMLQHCTIDPEHVHLLGRGGASACGEVSRVAVSKRFRQRAGDTAYGGPPRAAQPNADGPSAPVTASVQMFWPEIVGGLYKGIYQDAKRSGLSTLVVAMERGLYVLLKRMHIQFEPIGPEVDYYGPVRPYLILLRDFERTLARKSPATLWYLLDGLERSCWPRYARRLERSADVLFGAA